VTFTTVRHVVTQRFSVKKRCVTIETVAVLKAYIRIYCKTKTLFSFHWVGTSEGEDSGCEDPKLGVESEAGKKATRDSKVATKLGHQPVFGK